MKHPSHADDLVDTFSTPAVERLQTRARRRTLVAVGCANTFAILIVGSFWPTAWWAWGPMFLLLFPLASLRNMSIRGVTEIPLGHLDDRQAQLRMQSFHDAYHAAILVALIAGLAIGRGWLGGEPSPGSSFAFGAMLGTIGATLHQLPATMLAWRLPDEIDDGDALR